MRARTSGTGPRPSDLASIAAHPDLDEVFHGSMTRQSRHQNTALVATYDFSPFRVVADIGGGHGPTLAAILAAHRVSGGSRSPFRR